ncbi:type IV pilus assembly protein PilM [Merismopedia glauca]|uniref:Pilus assembly protein PilM n=1 Tax=Merismopedia glauca CCAP 1448/3 TaxID=1296344 RepID=A0A2T1BXL4_9CYAN|nr:type IV pilus assembly protein PilM [Merismopedia glauca]PSB00663.1 pilus assembly protein PilM [Merismopedia glauca CCAP 1448/3]
MFNRIKSLVPKRGKGIGIEIGSERINIARIRKQGQAFKASLFPSVEVPEGIFEDGHIVNSTELCELIQSALAENKLKVNRVATALPMREAVMRIIPVPEELEDEELRDVLNQEASLYLPYPREQVDLDYQKLGVIDDEDGIAKVQVLLVATRKEVTDSYIETFQKAGLIIDVLEINSFALIRTIREQLRQFSAQEAVVLVDIEYDTTEVAIIVNGVPQFNRSIPIGTYHLQSSLTRAMNLPNSRKIELLQGMTIPSNPPPQDGTETGYTESNPGMAALIRVLGELADELRRSTDFYKSQNENLKIEQMLLAGPGSAIGQLDEFLTQRLNLSTIKIDPVSALGLQLESEISEVQRSEIGTVLGLAMRQV